MRIFVILLFVIDNSSRAVRVNKLSKFNLPERFQGNDKSVLLEYAQLSYKYNPINLGEGLPDFLPARFVRNSLLNVTLSDDYSAHQYSYNYGHPKLRQVIAKLYSELINRNLHPTKNVIITTGATEALYLTIQAHTSPGDEWILIEPSLVLYDYMIKMAGGIPKYVQLKPIRTGGQVSSHWVYEKKEIARLFSKKTKGIIVNNPHNPIGKVFSRDELQFIAHLAIKWNTLVVTDEVYEWLIYKPNKHVRIASMSDMFERTITISSASKTLSVTGWRVGWAYGPSNLLSNLKALHPNVVYSNPTAVQLAVANSLEVVHRDLGQSNSYLSKFALELQLKRDEMLELFEHVGMRPIVPEGGYYIMANWTGLEARGRLDEELDEYDDYRFTKWLAKNVGVLGIPVSAFYSAENKRWGERYVRFCFVKKNKTLLNAARLLARWIQER